MTTADTPDVPLTPPGNAPADGSKPMTKSKTIALLAAAAAVQLLQGVAQTFGYEWAVAPLAQLQLFLLGLAGAARVAATGPLK